MNLSWVTLYALKCMYTRTVSFHLYWNYKILCILYKGIEQYFLNILYMHNMYIVFQKVFDTLTPS